MNDCLHILQANLLNGLELRCYYRSLTFYSIVTTSAEFHAEIEVLCIELLYRVHGSRYPWSCASARFLSFQWIHAIYKDLREL